MLAKAKAMDAAERQQDFLVWMVAAFSATETFLQALIGVLHAQFLDGAIWLVGSGAIFVLAAILETLKMRRLA